MAEIPIIVIDNGGCTIKAGHSGEDYPTVVVPNAIGLQEFSNLTDKATFEKYIAVHSKDKNLKVRYPVSHGYVKDWDSMTTVWSHVVEDHLHVDPKEVNVLLTEPISNSKPAREKMAEILFEALNFNAISIASSAILPMYAAGLTSGIVLDVGDGATQVAPVWGGYPITEAMQIVDFGGNDVTHVLRKDLMERKILPSKIPTTTEVFRLIKEKTCYVVPNNDEATGKTIRSTEYVLPSGEKIQLGEEALKYPEFLFNPSRFEQLETIRQGIHQLVYKSIMKTNIDVRKDLYANVVLNGGSTLFPGFVERLENELRNLVPPSIPIRIVANPARKYFTWIGGSVLASLNSFSSTLISKHSWEDGSGRIAVNNVYS